MKFDEKFIDKNIALLCKDYDCIRGSNVNIARITPDFIDGLKPVARRLLYIMFLKEQGKKYRKVAAITGDTIARLHHHSQSSVKDCLDGLAQWWKNNIPLIDGYGNFGSVAGDEAGADRYIQARLSEYAIECFFSDWRESSVDMQMGADEETKEPLYLPAKYPNVLLNGSLGIGYGMASNLFPANFRETVEAVILLMHNPDADIVIIPDSPTGCDIIAGDFKKMCDSGNAGYSMRCKYEICSEENEITITNLPYQVTVNSIREKIADIKERNGLPELIAMSDFSGKTTDLRLKLRDDVNPYKFMKKLIAEVGGLEKSYPVNISVTNDYQSFDWSIKKLLIEWIRYRREQKRVTVGHQRTSLLSEQRTNDVKIFVMSGDNLQITNKIYTTSRNKKEIEQRLIERYRDTEIRMDSLQAKTLSEMREFEKSIEAYEGYLKKREEIKKDLEVIENILNAKNGIDKLIIGELRDGIKRFGSPRKSNVVSYKISIDTEVQGACILQISSDGMILRKIATNVEEEPVPADSNGFAVKVDNDSSFILIDEKGYYSFIRVKELPVDQEVPLNRFIKQTLDNIVAVLPFDFESDRCCTLISKLGMIKKMKISDISPSKRPCIDISKEDKLIKGIITKMKSPKDILVYTKEGMGQRLDPNMIKITSTLAKGISGFKLSKDDEIVGCYDIDPEENQYLLYITSKGKARLNAIDYLPMRDSKHDTMVRLISLNDRDSLIGIVGCNKLDKVQVYFQDGETEIIDISRLNEETMSSEPKKVTSRNAVSNNIVKTKLV
jgi:DNA gyrase subunit A